MGFQPDEKEKVFSTRFNAPFQTLIFPFRFFSQHIEILLIILLYDVCFYDKHKLSIC